MKEPLGNPTFYIYEDENGWHKTDKELTAKLNSPRFYDPKLLAGRSFYPQWPEPEFKSQTRIAWFIQPDCTKVVRTETINDGKRGYRKARMLRWDADKKFWVLCETQQDQQQLTRR